MSGLRFPEEKVKFVRREQEQSDCEEMDWEDELHSNQRQEKRRQRVQPVPALSAEDFKILCPERAENFFDKGSTKLGTSIFIKTSYHPMKSQYFTYIKKLNDTENPMIDHTYIKISDFELCSVKNVIQDLITEIEGTPRSDLVPRLAKSTFAKLEKSTDPNYWSEEFTETVGSLKIRPYRDARGGYNLKLHCPKRSGFEKTWAGPLMTIPLGLCKILVEELGKQLQLIECMEKEKHFPIDQSN